MSRIAIALLLLAPFAAGQTFTLDTDEYSPGQDIVVTWSGGPANATDWIGIYSDPGNGPVNGVNVGPSTIWLYTNGAQAATVGAADGAVTFSAPALPPGTYIAFLLANDGYVSIAPAVPFRVVSDGTGTLSFDSETYGYDQSLTATWTGPGNAADWVGIYRPGEVPGDVNSTLWAYTNGTQSASGSFSTGSHTFDSPGLDPGDWVAYFFENDSYSVLAGPVSFSVNAPPASQAPQFVTDPFRRAYGIAGSAYTGKLAAHVRDDDIADSLAFSKISGPGWLTIAPDGTLSGTPTAVDVGINSFAVEVTDSVPLSDTATFTIEVFAPGAVDISSLKALAFNVWVGTNNVEDGYDKGIESVIISDADIIAVSENNGRAAQWADDLGWHVYQLGSDDAVLSRYPIVETLHLLGGGWGEGARRRRTPARRYSVVAPP